MNEWRAWFPHPLQPVRVVLLLSPFCHEKQRFTMRKWPRASHRITRQDKSSRYLMLWGSPASDSLSHFRGIYHLTKAEEADSLSNTGAPEGQCYLFQPPLELVGTWLGLSQLNKLQEPRLWMLPVKPKNDKRGLQSLGCQSWSPGSNTRQDLGGRKACCGPK